MKKQKYISKEEALSKMEFLASGSEKCESDITSKLEGLGLNNDEISWVKNSLKKNKFIDDKRFAGFYVKDKFSISKWGREKIKHGLRYKQISQVIIDEALHTIDENEYKETLRQLLINKNKSIKGNDPYVRKGKLYRFAAQRGYELSLITDMIE